MKCPRLSHGLSLSLVLVAAQACGSANDTLDRLDQLTSAETWAEFWQPIPKPRHHDIMALIREGKMRIEGDLDMMLANLLTLKLMLEKPRRLGAAS